MVPYLWIHKQDFYKMKEKSTNWIGIAAVITAIATLLGVLLPYITTTAQVPSQEEICEFYPEYCDISNEEEILMRDEVKITELCDKNPDGCEKLKRFVEDREQNNNDITLRELGDEQNGRR